MASGDQTTEREYLIEYPYQGSRWTVTVVASSWGDARARLDAIRAWGKVEGEIHEKVPAPVGLGWLARLYAGLRLEWLQRSGR